MRNHYIRLAEIVQEGVTDEFAELFRVSERKIDLDGALSQLAKMRTVHQGRAAEIWKKERKVTPELQRSSALADLCAFFAACLTGGAAEYRDTALEAMETLGYPGDKTMIRLLASKET